jgi:lipopolysaccharide export system protein LptC
MTREEPSPPPVPPDKSAMADRWLQRKRSSARDTFRYTQFVTFMRHLLPLAVLALIGVVLAYALYPREKDRIALSYAEVAGVAGDLSMKKPRLSGVDSQGNPYLITADLAVQTERNARKVSLKNVAADMQFDGQRWANATSGTGFVDLDARHLDLRDQIALYTDDGYELHTKSASADLDKNIISGRDRVTGQGPMGTFGADQFVIDRGRRHVTLEGHVFTKLYPKRVKR